MPTTQAFSLTPLRLVLLTPIFLILTGNHAFFEKLTDVYPVSAGNWLFLLSLAVLYYCIILLLELLFSLLIPTRIVVSFFILLAAVCGYYTDQLGTVIDSDMIRNIVETNISEASELLTASFILRVITLGIIPVFFIWLMPFKKTDLTKHLRLKILSAAISIIVIVLCIMPLSDHYASFFREHKPVRYYCNPVFPIYSAGKYITQEIKAGRIDEFIYLTKKAQHTVGRKPELVIVVVGETARSDRFSLNGYSRDTNPELSKIDNVISYSNMSSCGTSTAISVPCMFAYTGHDAFDPDTAAHTQNALDILNMAGVNVLWRDNNSDSKGVATNITYQDFKSPDINPDCDIECRDTGLIDGLQTYIDNHTGDILIVLHQMGSHGPAYYKRYPKSFEKFTPACLTAELSQCSNEEINNAYDNTILYTDFFLAKTIHLLQKNTQNYETAMFYISDHGESLGEKGLYLHGMPYIFAPREQTHVAAITWVGESSDIDYQKTMTLKDSPHSHDTVFNTLLSVFEISTDLSLPEVSPLVYLKDDPAL